MAALPFSQLGPLASAALYRGQRRTAADALRCVGELSHPVPERPGSAKPKTPCPCRMLFLFQRENALFRGTAVEVRDFLRYVQEHSGIAPEARSDAHAVVARYRAAFRRTLLERDPELLGGVAPNDDDVTHIPAALADEGDSDGLACLDSYCTEISDSLKHAVSDYAKTKLRLPDKVVSVILASSGGFPLCNPFSFTMTYLALPGTGSNQKTAPDLAEICSAVTGAKPPWLTPMFARAMEAGWRRGATPIGASGKDKTGYPAVCGHDGVTGLCGHLLCAFCGGDTASDAGARPCRSCGQTVHAACLAPEEASAETFECELCLLGTAILQRFNAAEDIQPVPQVHAAGLICADNFSPQTEADARRAREEARREAREEALRELAPQAEAAAKRAREEAREEARREALRELAPQAEAAAKRAREAAAKRAREEALRELAPQTEAAAKRAREEAREEALRELAPQAEAAAKRAREETEEKLRAEHEDDLANKLAALEESMRADREQALAELQESLSADRDQALAALEESMSADREQALAELQESLQDATGASVPRLITSDHKMTVQQMKDACKNGLASDVTDELRKRGAFVSCVFGKDTLVGHLTEKGILFSDGEDTPFRVMRLEAPEGLEAPVHFIQEGPSKFTKPAEVGIYFLDSPAENP